MVQQVLNLTNTTGGDITLDDLGGVTILDTVTKDLIADFGLSFDDIAKSTDLQAAVAAGSGNISLSDGTRTISTIADLQDYFSDLTGHGLATVLASTASGDIWGASQIGHYPVSCLVSDNVQDALAEICAGFPNSPDFTFLNNVTIQGDLIVNGDTTTLNVSNLEVEDDCIILNRGGNTTTAQDSGICVDRGTGQDGYAAIIWDEAGDRWVATYGDGHEAADGYNIITENELASTSTDVSGSASSAGTSTNVSREDHTHLGVRSINADGYPDIFGDVEFNAGPGAKVTQAGQVITIGLDQSTFDYNDSGDLSQIDAGDTEVEGVLDEVARADHQHAVNTALVGDLSPVGPSNDAGTSSTLARGDHQHEGVHNIAADGYTPATGDIILDGYGKIVVTQENNTIYIDDGSTIGGGTPTAPNEGDRFYHSDIDYRMWFTWDEGTGKWLSDNRKDIVFNNNSANTTDQYLRLGDTRSNLAGFRMPHDAVITGIALQANAAQTWTAELRKNDSATVIASLASGGAAGADDMSLDVDIAEADFLQVYLNGTSIDYPVCWIEAVYRLDAV